MLYSFFENSVREEIEADSWKFDEENSCTVRTVQYKIVVIWLEDFVSRAAVDCIKRIESFY